MARGILVFTPVLQEPTLPWTATERLGKRHLTPTDINPDWWVVTSTQDYLRSLHNSTLLNITKMFKIQLLQQQS